MKCYNGSISLWKFSQFNTKANEKKKVNKALTLIVVILMHEEELDNIYLTRKKKGRTVCSKNT